ncbi:MAG: DUF2141 domain-containing protein [Flavobacteriales bacterium]|nr:DUF2141 domain-containing protein [Flavobacteriales bacterium]
MSINGPSFAQEAEKKSKKQIVRNNVYFTTAETGAHSLNLNVIKLKSNDGYVMLVLSDENGEQIAVTKAPIVDNKCSVSIDSLPSGKYAVQYYHDQNSNGKLDTGSFGIPEEGYGSSNDARGFMGPPDFQDMIFELKDDVTMKMKTVN